MISILVENELAISEAVLSYHTVPLRDQFQTNDALAVYTLSLLGYHLRCKLENN